MNDKCVMCGRKQHDTVLNIEGAIHHNCDCKCIDTKSCNRVARKMRKKGNITGAVREAKWFKRRNK